MVNIRYYRTASCNYFEQFWVDRLGDWLIDYGFTQKELIDLRFFKTDILGQEIDTSDPSFLDISDDVTIEVFDSTTMPRGPVLPYVPLIIAALTAVVTLAMIPSISSTSTDTVSSTNKLSDSQNSEDINGRIPEVIGYVARHVPPLWQVPYRIGVNNTEVEVQFLCVGRGKYDIDMDNWRDGDTRLINIPNAQCSVYEPGTHPGNGDPSQQIGDDIDQSLGIYREVMT